MQITTAEGRAAAQTAIDVTGGGGNPLATLTIAQAETWIENNVTGASLATALTAVRFALKVVARLLILIRDQQAALRRRQAAIEERLTNAGL